MSDLPSNWGITTPDQLLSNLRVAETGGDIAECADALEWMLGSRRLVDRETINVEAVAAVEHDQWAHWTAYMLDNLSRENIIRWSLQIETPYAELTEAEKDSDREWANKAIDAALVEV